MPKGVTLAFFAVVALAPAYGRASLPTLGAVNVISGSASARMDVVLPAPAMAPYFVAGNDVVITGKGRVFGFALVSDQADYIALRYGNCYTPACEPWWPWTVLYPAFTPINYPAGDTVTLPAGVYHLHLITDGAPVRVTFRLQGVGGSRDLRPTTPWSPDGIKTIKTRRALAAQRQVFLGDTAGPLQTGRRFYVFGADSVRTPAALVDEKQCVFEGDPPRAGVYDHLCLQSGDRTIGGGGWISFSGGFAAANSNAVLTRAPTTKRLGIGVHIDSAGWVKAVGAVALWLAFDVGAPDWYPVA